MRGTANGSPQAGRRQQEQECDGARQAVDLTVPKHSPVQHSPALGSAQLSGAHWQC